MFEFYTIINERVNETNLLFTNWISFISLKNVQNICEIYWNFFPILNFLNRRTNSFRFNSFSWTESISAITTWLATRYLPRTPWALLPAPYLDVCQRPINSNMSARGLCQQLPRVIRLGALHSVGHFSPSADWDVRECPHLAVTLLAEWKLKKLICFYFLVLFLIFEFLNEIVR